MMTLSVCVVFLVRYICICEISANALVRFPVNTSKTHFMENTATDTSHLIVHAYDEYYASIQQYIAYRINHKYDAEDLAQDVFVRLLDYKQMLRPETVRYFIYTIARNMVTDYIRRYYKRQEIDYFLYETLPVTSNETEEKLLADNIAELEHLKVQAFPAQRKAVYTLNRYEEQSVPEIAELLNLSRRTVENHLFLGRKEVRAYMKEII